MKIAFLDRDGTIVSDYPDEDWKGRIIPEVLDGALEGMKRLRQLGFEIIIVTNQYIINDGIITTDEYEQFTQNLKTIFDENNVKVLDIFHCPHSSHEKCKCKKPMTGMIESALAKYPSIELSNSIMIGDSESDHQLAINMNIKFYKMDSSKSVGMNGVYQSIEEIIEQGNIDE